MRYDSPGNEVWISSAVHPCNLPARDRLCLLWRFFSGRGTAGFLVAFCRRGPPGCFVASLFDTRNLKASSVNFFHVAALLQFLQNTRQETPSVMLELHSMSDSPHTGGLRKCFQVGENKFRRDFVRYCRFAGFFRMAWARCHTVLDRLTDLTQCSKG